MQQQIRIIGNCFTRGPGRVRAIPRCHDSESRGGREDSGEISQKKDVEIPRRSRRLLQALR